MNVIYKYSLIIEDESYHLRRVIKRICDSVMGSQQEL